MPVELYLARRYLFDRRHGSWGWMISWIATASVAIGVGALIATLAVMTGFREDIQEKLLGIQPHLVISPPFGPMSAKDPALIQALKEDAHVQAWSPFVNGQVLFGHGSQTSGAVLKGVDPATENLVVNIKGRLDSGSWEAFEGKVFDRPPVLLGRELARNIGARVGDEIWAMTPGAQGLTPYTMPKATVLRVAGLVKTGLYDYDSSIAFIPLSSSQKIFGGDANLTGIGVRLKNPNDASQVAKDIQAKMAGAYWVRSWLSLNQNLFSALKLEKTVMFVILILVTLVAAFMIVSNLLLIIAQKTRDIGILRAMGATRETIRRVFLFQGLLMGFFGNLGGVLLGFLISWILGTTNLIKLPADVYYIDQLPVRIEIFDVLTVVVASSIIILIASLIPARRAANLNPLEAIRYG